jgi:Putative binding domain, N-terminal
MVMGALLANSCGGSEFPVSPTPVATSPVTVQQGNTYQGTVILPSGETASFNMTLIARGLAQLASTASVPPGSKSLSTSSASATAVDVSGNYATGRGVRGAVQGTLTGSLDNGMFTGTLTTDGAGCGEERRYSGPMTSSGIAWQAGAWLRTCPVSELTFSVQIGQSRTAPCTYDPSITSVSFSGAGGIGTVSVQASPACPWIAEAPEPWVTIEGASTRVGPGTIEFHVQPNPGGAERQASLRIAGHTVTVEQGPACRFSLSPGAASVSGAGGRATVAITAPATCPWSVQPLVDWIVATPSEGVSSATVTLSVAANSGPEREGSVQIADRTFAILQGAAPIQCTTAIAPSVVDVAPAGAGGSVQIQAPPGCGWSAETSVDWLTLLGPTAGSGPGTVSYAVQPNQGTTRTGTARIAGQTFTVTQGPVTPQPCTYTIAPTGASVPKEGTKGTVAITTQSGCAWNAQSLADWIVIIDVSAGPGRDGITYLVNPNPGAPRSGTMRIAGHMFTVDQAGCTYSVKPVSWDAPSGGGPQTVDVSSLPAGCAWTPTTSDDWITITGVQGSSGGSGAFSIRVDPFTIDATLLPRSRTGIVTVGTAKFTITQMSRYP